MTVDLERSRKKRSLAPRLGGSEKRRGADTYVIRRREVTNPLAVPTFPRMAEDPLDRLRTICLELPDAHEVIAWGEPTFRVRNKQFAMYANAGNHHGDGRNAVWCKSDPTTQQHLIRSDPKRYFVPPYVGPSGWVGIWLDRRPSWKAIAEILQDSWRLAAPKSLRGGSGRSGR